MEIVRRVYEAVMARKETPRELLTPDYEVDAADVAFEGHWPRRYEGSEKVLREYWQLFEDFHIDVEEVIDAGGERLITIVRDGGRMRGSDREVRNRYFHVWTLRCRKDRSAFDSHR